MMTCRSSVWEIILWLVILFSGVRNVSSSNCDKQRVLQRLPGQATIIKEELDAALIISCNIGYIPKQQRLQCVAGVWNGTVECNIVNCGHPPPISNGTVRYAKTVYGSVALYSCDEGYRLHGPSRRNCTSDGSWEEGDASCLILHPPQVSQGVIAGIITVTVLLLMCGVVLIFVVECYRRRLMSRKTGRTGMWIKSPHPNDIGISMISSSRDSTPLELITPEPIYASVDVDLIQPYAETGQRSAIDTSGAEVSDIEPYAEVSRSGQNLLARDRVTSASESNEEDEISGYSKPHKVTNNTTENIDDGLNSLYSRPTEHNNNTTLNTSPSKLTQEELDQLYAKPNKRPKQPIPQLTEQEIDQLYAKPDKRKPASITDSKGDEQPEKIVFDQPNVFPQAHQSTEV